MIDWQETTHLATGHVKSRGLPLKSDAIACAMKIVVTSAAPSAGFSTPRKYTDPQYMRDPRKPVRSGNPGALISEGPAVHHSGQVCSLLSSIVSAVAQQCKAVSAQQDEMACKSGVRSDARRSLGLAVSYGRTLLRLSPFTSPVRWSMVSTSSLPPAAAMVPTNSAAAATPGNSCCVTSTRCAMMPARSMFMHTCTGAGSVTAGTTPCNS